MTQAILILVLVPVVPWFKTSEMSYVEDNSLVGSRPDLVFAPSKNPTK